MYYPSRDEFEALAASANLVPVYRELVADLDTPISVYRKVCRGGPSFLLESVEGGEKVARYSFLGCDPFIVFCSRGDLVEVTTTGSHRVRAGGQDDLRVRGNPLEILRGVMARYRPASLPGLPRFYGGAVGYLGYDLVRFIEHLPAPPPQDLELPDSLLVFPATVVVFDHVRHTVKVIHNARIEDPCRAGEVYDLAVAAVEAVLRRLEETGRGASGYDLLSRWKPGISSRPLPEARSNMERHRFEEAVRQAKEYIAAGDIFQVVLSQRLEAPCSVTPFQVYRALRSINPSPYMFFLDFGELALVGSSPELLVRVENGVVETRPIAGTRPRGATPDEDVHLERDLLADEKERAEHLMLVDLGRNDLGRVCRYGTVKVDDFMTVERYSHVMHIVTEVHGRLEEGKDAFDALAACFPAGTVSGAPKVRAMEIIDELEATRRGPYAGAVGYFGFTGNMDTCITIRTMVIRGNRAYVQAGAGIVADSVPSREYEETMSKARALLRALEVAEGGSYDPGH